MCQRLCENGALVGQCWKKHFMKVCMSVNIGHYVVSCSLEPEPLDCSQVCRYGLIIGFLLL